MTTKDAMIQATFMARGRILQKAIELEAVMDRFVTAHFTCDEEKEAELICLILAPRVTLENKLQIFRYLADKHYPSFKQRLPQYFNHIKELIEQRNIFAHWPVDFSSVAMERYEKERKLTLIRLKSSTYKPDGSIVNEHYYDESQVNGLIAGLRVYVNNISLLMGLDIASNPSV